MALEKRTSPVVFGWIQVCSEDSATPEGGWVVLVGVILGVTQTSTPHPSTAALEDYSLTNLKKTRLDTDAGVGLSALVGTAL